MRRRSGGVGRMNGDELWVKVVVDLSLLVNNILLSVLVGREEEWTDWESISTAIK